MATVHIRVEQAQARLLARASTKQVRTNMHIWRSRSLDLHATVYQGIHPASVKLGEIKWLGIPLLGRFCVVRSVCANWVWSVFFGISLGFSFSQSCCAVADELSSELSAASSTENETKAVTGKRDLILVMGAGGTDEYETEFRDLDFQ